MSSTTVVGGVSTLVSSLMTVSQANEIFQWIQVGITILCGVCTLISVFRGWRKEAKKDGKITKEELKDLQEKVTDALSAMKKSKKKSNKEDDK